MKVLSAQNYTALLLIVVLMNEAAALSDSHRSKEIMKLRGRVLLKNQRPHPMVFGRREMFVVCVETTVFFW